MARSFVLGVAALLAVVRASEGGDAGYTELEPATFSSHVGGAAGAFVAFTAPWCGHCKNLKPTWAELATTFAKDAASVGIFGVDADAHKDLGGKYGVQSVPTIKWFPAGSDEGEDYSGGRTIEDLVAFVNGKTGLSRKCVCGGEGGWWQSMAHSPHPNPPLPPPGL